LIERTDRMALVYKGSPPNHTCCDQALRILPDGTWVVVFMTGGVREPEVDNHVVLCRSTDYGMTWGKPEVVLQYPDRGATLSEVMVLDGRLILMAQTHDGYFGQWRVWSLESADGGRTWSEPEPFSPCPRRSFVRNLYRASWGTWYLPMQSYPVVDDVDASPLRDGSHRLAENWVLRSDDEGQTWTPSERIGPMAGWAENNLVELSDGRLIMLVRGDGTGSLWRSESLDRGASWTPRVSTEIPNPGSKFRLFRLGDGRIALVHNPNPATRHPNSKPAAQCNRNPLALWISDDDMRTWGYQRDLVRFPGMLAYPDGVLDEDSGYIHLAFDYNRHDVIYWGAALPAP